MKEVLERYRNKKGCFKSNEGDNFGLFFIPVTTHKAPLKVICAPMDSEWQHVSVSLPNRCPSWSEMNYIKSLFWNDNETVVQFHPKKSEYVDNCKFCLHLWRHKDDHELPPSMLVGLK